MSGAGLRTVVAATVCGGLVDDVLDQLRHTVRVVAVVHDLDNDRFRRTAILRLHRQHATDQAKERGGMFLGLLGQIADDAVPAPSFFGGLDDRVPEQPVRLVGDARLAPRTGFATTDLIRALGVFPCYFFIECPTCCW